MRGGGVSISSAWSRRALAVVTAVATVGAWQAGSARLAIGDPPPAPLSVCDGVLPNLVHNCGFELGTIGSWTLTKAATGSDVATKSDIPPHSGVYALSLGAEKGDGTAAQDDRVAQLMQTTPGATYVVSFWLANPKANGAEEGGLGPDFSASLSGVQGSGVLLSGHYPVSFGYTQFIGEFTATGSAVTLAFAGAKLSSWFDIDDVVVSPLSFGQPPPAPSVKVSSSQNPASVGSSLTFTATVSPVPLCGAVSWLVDNVSTFAKASGTPGTYILGPVTDLAPGVHPVTAAYSGCGHVGVSSGTVIEQVGTSNQPPPPPPSPSPTPTPTVSSSPSPSPSPTPKVTDPTITATVSSPDAERDGWYRDAVTVTFLCAPGSAPLAGQCPTPVVLSSSGKAQSVTESVSDLDGGTASVTATVDIDLGGPTLTVRPRAGTCAAHDSLSGPRSCVVHKHRTTTRHVTTVHWTATGSDVAGNRTTGTGSYRVM